jgi:hypothetical protein
MKIPTLREETCKRKIEQFRRQMVQADVLTTEERERLIEEMQAFCDSLSTGNVVLGGAGLGLGASILPVIGTISGPVIGGIYGAYKAHKLSPYRDEVLAMIRRLAR